jgi:far upstream element-binding protein
VKMQLIQENKAITGPKPLQITGYPEKVETARRFIEENYCVPDSMGFHHASPSYQSGPKCILQVVVPKSFVGLIIGKNGEMIKKISYESGAKIQFDNDETENPDERKAIVQGTKAQVDRAAVLIAEIIDSQAYYMHVPASKSGAVIGKGGETIQQVCYTVPR